MDSIKLTSTLPPRPVYASPDQGCEDALYQMGSSKKINDRESERNRRLIGVTVEPGQSRKRLHEKTCSACCATGLSARIR